MTLADRISRLDMRSFYSIMAVAWSLLIVFDVIDWALGGYSRPFWHTAITLLVANSYLILRDLSALRAGKERDE